jgi:hypothetical protein
MLEKKGFPLPFGGIEGGNTGGGAFFSKNDKNL